MENQLEIASDEHYHNPWIRGGKLGTGKPVGTNGGKFRKVSGVKIGQRVEDEDVGGSWTPELRILGGPLSISASASAM